MLQSIASFIGRQKQGMSLEMLVEDFERNGCFHDISGIQYYGVV